jgi:hypothetical protein
MKKESKKNQVRENDRKLTEKEFIGLSQKISALHLSGKYHFCELKQGQIHAKACDNTQKTAGCKIGPANKSTLTGCSCWEQILADEFIKKSGGAKKKSKSSGPVKNSYQTIITRYLLTNGVAKIENLVDEINSDITRQEVKRPADNKNTSVGVSILRNPTRTKIPLNIQYSRITGLYYLMTNEKAAAQYKSDMGKIESDKKSKKTDPQETPAEAKPLTK